MNLKTPMMTKLDEILKTGLTDRQAIMNYVYDINGNTSERSKACHYVNFNSLLKRYREKGNIVDVRRGYVCLIEAVK